MAGIGLYGVYYAKATMSNGVVTGYSGGTKMMGKAISATFEPNEVADNPLYANNSIAENDTNGSGGTLTLTLDKLTQEAFGDLYGLTQQTVNVTVNSTTATGKGFSFTGNERSAPVGVAFIKQKQESNNRDIHEVLIYRNVTFSRPSEDAQTMGENIEWQTPEIEGTVFGKEGDGTNAWFMTYTFDSLEAGIAYIESILGEPED